MPRVLFSLSTPYRHSKVHYNGKTKLKGFLKLLLPSFCIISNDYINTETIIQYHKNTKFVAKFRTMGVDSSYKEIPWLFCALACFS